MGAELLLGVSLGWAAGIAPGPLNSLIVATGLRSGRRPAIAVALAPLVGDLLVVPIALGLVGLLDDGVVRALSLVGGVWLVWLGIDTFRARHRTDAEAGARALAKGVMTNLANPHPWLFWFTVGAPVVLTAWVEAPAAAVAFVVGFYTLLVVSKVGLAWLAAGAGRRYERWQGAALTVSALLLVLLGILLLAGR